MVGLALPMKTAWEDKATRRRTAGSVVKLCKGKPHERSGMKQDRETVGGVNRKEGEKP